MDPKCSNTRPGSSVARTWVLTAVNAHSHTWTVRDNAHAHRENYSSEKNN